MAIETPIAPVLRDGTRAVMQHVRSGYRNFEGEVGLHAHRVVRVALVPVVSAFATTIWVSLVAGSLLALMLGFAWATK